MPPPDLIPLDLSDDDLDRLSPITERDIIITDRFVTKEVDPEFENLLLTISEELAELEDNANTPQLQA